MSDIDLESPDADAAEQAAAATPQDTEPEDEPTAALEPPLEADPADADEQSRILDLDDDEYR
jgi:hypothetical protein